MAADLTTTADRYDYLRERDVLVERDGRVAITEAFDSARRVYHDSYGDIDDERFHATLADLFEMSVADAKSQAAELGITRDQLVAYLSLRSYLDDGGAVPDPNDLVSMAGIVADVAPVSPVPEDMRELTDDDYAEFVAEHGDAVVFVWKLHCAPCDAMKGELDEVLGLVPDGVAVAGVNGEKVTAFRREFGVDAAPATVTFADGDHHETLESRRKPERLAELFDEAF
ncbi:thioredoxin family protein [Halosegnis marinus]|uniref:Thioredoxin family protein n=1 Tax=Halosegnis marinus TaxID=3034023 RepID=A0ABD5ZRB4_9EURY|nr:thioredoxin family protein [Halosegnis sp. DT85]